MYNFTLAIDAQTDDHLALTLIAVPSDIDIKGRFVMYDTQAAQVVVATAMFGLPYHQISSDLNKYIGELAEDFLDSDDVDHEKVFGHVTEDYDYIHDSVSNNLPEQFLERLTLLSQTMDGLTDQPEDVDPNALVAAQLLPLDILYLGESK